MFFAGAETLMIAREDFYEWTLRFEVEECWENYDGNTERSKSEKF